MREIKFRAWNIVTKTMIDLRKITPLILNTDDTAGIFIPDETDGLFVMQYTGLKDKDDIEIYEGDIVESFCNINKISDPRLTKREPEFDSKAVKFKDGAFILYNNEYDFCGVLGYNAATKSETLNVIGNIYESPELFKA